MLTGVCMRRRALVTGAAAMLVAAGCDKSQKEPSARVTGPDKYPQRQQIAKEMLHRRARALLDGDEQAWLADIDPAKKETLDAERMRFANLSRLGLQSVDLIPDSVSATRPPPRVAGPSAYDPPYEGYVKGLFQLACDTALTRSDYLCRFRWDGKKFLITEVLPIRSSGETEKYAKPHLSGLNSVIDNPWDEMPLKFVKAGSVIVAAARSSRWNPADLASTAQKANDFVRSVWGAEPAPKGFVVFLADARQAAEWFGPKGDVSAFPGFVLNPAIAKPDGSMKFTVPKPGEEAGQTRAGSRLVLNMDLIKTVDRAYPILVHEMAHAIGSYLMPQSAVLLDQKGNSSVLDFATWVIEGFAEWIEHISIPGELQRSLNQVRAGWSKYHKSRSDPGFPGNDHFYDAKPIAWNYDMSASFFAAVERVAGRAKAVAMYKHLIRQPVLVTDDRQFLDPMLRKQGIDPARLWATWHRMVGH
jgi:hypothetical protein